MSFLKKAFLFVSSPTHSRTTGILLILLILAAVPLTVIISQKQQEIRQHAAGSCSVTVDWSGNLFGPSFLPKITPATSYKFFDVSWEYLPAGSDFLLNVVKTTTTSETWNNVVPGHYKFKITAYTSADVSGFVGGDTSFVETDAVCPSEQSVSPTPVQTTTGFNCSGNQGGFDYKCDTSCTSPYTYSGYNNSGTTCDSSGTVCCVNYNAPPISTPTPDISCINDGSVPACGSGRLNCEQIASCNESCPNQQKCIVDNSTVDCCDQITSTPIPIPTSAGPFNCFGTNLGFPYQCFSGTSCPSDWTYSGYNLSGTTCSSNEVCCFNANSPTSIPTQPPNPTTAPTSPPGQTIDCAGHSSGCSVCLLYNSQCAWVADTSPSSSYKNPYCSLVGNSATAANLCKGAAGFTDVYLNKNCITNICAPLPTATPIPGSTTICPLNDTTANYSCSVSSPGSGCKRIYLAGQASNCDKTEGCWQCPGPTSTPTPTPTPLSQCLPSDCGLCAAGAVCSQVAGVATKSCSCQFPTSVSPTPNPSISPNLTPSPTPLPGSILLALSSTLDGITANRDLDAAAALQPVTIEVFDSANNQLKLTTPTNIINQVEYDSLDGKFKRTINLGNTLASGDYTIKIKAGKYLKKKISHIFTITSTTETQTIPVSTKLIGVDINNDKTVDILDYNFVINCYKDKQNTPICGNKKAGDLNYDGVVDGIDYNILVRGIGHEDD